MSGGSGSRVNSHTKHLIDQEQHAIQERLDYELWQQQQSESDIPSIDPVWDHQSMLMEEPTQMQQREIDFIDQPEAECPYESMALGTIKITPIYDRHSKLVHDPSYREWASRILQDTFFWKNSYKEDLDECLRKIEECSNFQIVKVNTVKNKALYMMYDAYRKAYNIENERTHYHGSPDTHVISHQGFRGSACVRSVWGKGICTSSNFWEAAAYCDEDLMTGEIKVLIVNTLVGLHKVGSKDLMDFGVNEHGKAYNTVTNDRQTIFVALNEAQLNPIVEITMRYMHENKHTKTHNDFVQIYNQDLKNRILLNNSSLFSPVALAATAAATAAANLAKSLATVAVVIAPPKWIVKPHDIYEIGKLVTVLSSYKGKYLEYKGYHGVIDKSFANGSEFLLFIRLTHDKDGNPVTTKTVSDIRGLNENCYKFLPDRSWLDCLPCRQSHIKIRESNAFLKRQADNQPDDQPAAGAKKAHLD